MTFIGPVRFALLAFATLLLAACAATKDAAVFVTKTSFSLVDLDTTPASISVAYDRVEGYVGPRYVDGKIFPVAGSIEVGGGNLSRDVRQVYATGNGARWVTSTGTPKHLPQPAAVDEERLVFFATGTSVGLKIGFVDSASGLLPSSFVLGYKRKELSVIPVSSKSEPSVLATFDNTAGLDADAGAGKTTVKFGIQQYFATGEAADNLARQDAIRNRFRTTAAIAVGGVEQYRTEEAAQGRLALDTINCFGRVSDAKLDRVWNNAEDLGIFTKFDTLSSIRAAAPNLQRQRAIYMGDLGLLDAGDPAYTVALDFHKKAVCDLSKANS